MPYTFYILYSSRLDKYYLGHTGDAMEARLRRHNSNHKGFTGGKADWIVVYTEAYETKSEAYQRERTVKGWKSRRRMETLIGSAHPGP